jgi:SAM-dependent methyltransferase
MTPEQRESIVANAKYLREVRPIDPAEINEYVEGRPHPAAVRQALREEAPDLGLIERPDGSFEPVPEEPLEGLADAVERFPDRYARRLEDRLVERYGADWPTGESGDELREAIRRLKEEYFAGTEVSYDETAALGYAIYHLPDYYATVQYVLDDLVGRRLLSRSLRVVDVGAGVGGPAVGLADYLPEDALLEYHGVEPSPAADVLEDLLGETGRNVHATVHRERAESVDPPDCDLLLFGNVLSELDDPLAVVRRYAESLLGDGTLILLAPADLETSTGLREIERDLAGDGLAVYSPTVRLWAGEEPEDRCWSFDVRPDLDVPTFQRRLDDAAGGNGEFVNVDVQFSYALLRPDGTRRIAFDPDASRFAKMAETDRHVTERIDLAAVKLSHDLAVDADGGHPLYLIGDGSQSVDHYAVLTRETGLNAALADAEYGDLLLFESVLVLWNDDEEAYNLVVDEETVVDRIAPLR